MSIDFAARAALSLPRPLKRAIAVTADAALCALAVWVAFSLRLDHWVVLRGVQWSAVAISIVLAIPIFVVSGLYRAIFRYSGSTALATIAQAALVYSVLYATIITFVQIDTIPRTVGLIQPILLFLFVATLRVLTSWWLGGTYAKLIGLGQQRSVMIYGAGSAGRQLCQALASTELRVVGFLDDDPRLQGHSLMGKPVYSPSDIGALVERCGLTDILLAIPSASRKRRNEILELIRPFKVAVRTIPGLTDVARGRITTSEIRELDVDDLLGRDTVPPDRDLIARDLQDRVVLVTGAGGSIGSELCRQILSGQPQALLLVENSEPALYATHRELIELATKGGIDIQLVPLLASVTDENRVAAILQTWRPQTIYHAAAYKHVPLVEHNPAEGIRNNVFGTLTVARAAMQAGVQKFVLVSTDKAVRPTNVMGATKRLAEQVLQALAAGPTQTCFTMVRFGNVLGSSGSVVPLFRRQIKAGGPVTITHPDITRFFMTIPEAAQLVLQSGAMAQGGEVFVLDMGEPVRILELARKMIELSGLKVRDKTAPDGDIEIDVVGLRPGEKLYEELLIGNNPAKTEHRKIMKANETFIAWPLLEAELNALATLCGGGNIVGCLDLLRRVVPEFTPEGAVVDFVFLETRQHRRDPVAA